MSRRYRWRRVSHLLTKSLAISYKSNSSVGLAYVLGGHAALPQDSASPDHP